MSRSTPSKSSSSSTRKSESSSRSKHHDKLSDSESASDSYSDSDWSTSGSDSDSDSDWSDEEKGTFSPSSGKTSSSSHSSSKKKSSSSSSYNSRASSSSSSSSYSKKPPKSFGSKLRQSLKLSCKLLCMPLLLLWAWGTSFAKQQLLSRFPTVFKRGQSIFLQLRARFWPIDVRKLVAFWFGKLLFVAFVLWLLRDDSLPTPYGRTKPGLGVLVTKKEALELARGVDSKLDLPFGGHVAFKPPTTTAHARTHAHATANGKLVDAAAHVDAHNLAAQQRSLSLLSASAEVSWAPPKSSLYSHMFCIGGKGKMGTQQERSCRFQNLCYRFHDRAWRYFVDPSEKDTPIILQHGKMYTAFPASFLSLGSRSAVPILVDPDAKRKRREAESAAAAAELKSRKQEAYAFGQARAPDAIGFHRPGFPGAQVAAPASSELVIRYDAGPWFTAAKVMSSSIPSEWFVPRWSKMKQHSNAAGVGGGAGGKGETLYGSISADGASPSLGAGAGTPFEKAQPDLYIYFAPTDPLSPARMFARDIIPLYHLMRSFDMEHRSVQLLTPYDCEQLYAAPQYDEELNLILEGVYTDEEIAAQQLCELVSNSLVFPGFTTRPPLVLSNLQKHKQKLMEHLGWMPTTSVQHLMKGIGGNTAAGGSGASGSSDAAHGSSAHATAEALAKGQHICFSDILMGIGVWNGEAVNSYQNVRQFIPAFREFREFYLHNLALHEAKLSTVPSSGAGAAATTASNVGSFTAAKRAAAAAAPKLLTHHRITILSHPGPNASPYYPLVNNYEELKSHLSTVYSTQHSRVEIELLDLHALGWREAVKRIQRTTILICYGSEDDALALFLPKASAVILLDYSPVERATNHTKLGNQPRAAPHQIAIQRISQMEASERGAPVTEPPPFKAEDLTIAATSGVDPRQQMQQRQPAPPVGSQMLAHLGLFRTFHYTLSPIEINETPEDALNSIPKLHVKVNLQKMSVLIDAAKMHVETFIHQ